MILKATLIDALNEKLAVKNFKDYSHNGLQVDSVRTEIRKVCSGVDGTLPFFEAAAKSGADLVICHHGISWGDSLKQITNVNFKLVNSLISNQLALWACHLPLDANRELGNNALLAGAIGLDTITPFGNYNGNTIGFAGEFKEPLSREAFADIIKAKISPKVDIHPFGKGMIKSVAIISGGGSGNLQEAIDLGYDAFLTGETDLAVYNNCLQSEMNMFAAGHYATEKFGIRAVGEWIAREFGIEHEFIDFDLPY